MATLNHFLQRGTPKRWQLNIIDIFNIPDTLAQRGFQVSSECSLDETLISTKVNPLFNDSTEEGRKICKDFLEAFNSKKNRILLREIIFEGASKKFPINSLISLTFEASGDNTMRYAKTMELLLAYLCVKDLKAFSAASGLKISGAPTGSDFDCIANFQNTLFYCEVKSGSVLNISRDELKQFIARHNFLAPEASILFLDYEGGNSNVIDELINKFSGLENVRLNHLTYIRKAVKIEKDKKKFYMLSDDLIVVDLGKNGDIVSNLRAVMEFVHRKRQYRPDTTFNPNFEPPQPILLGYKSTLLTLKNTSRSSIKIT